MLRAQNPTHWTYIRFFRKRGFESFRVCVSLVMQTWNTPRYTGHRHTVGQGGVVFTPPSANLACGDVALGQIASPHPHLTISKVALLQEDIQAETIGPGLSELLGPLRQAFLTRLYQFETDCLSGSINRSVVTPF
jgi:hypothetical protein